MTRKSIQTKPNYYWISFVIFFLILMVAITWFFCYLGYSLYFDSGKKSEAYIFLFPTILFSTLTICAFFIIANRMNFAVANAAGLRIVFPMKFKSVLLEWSVIKGYSKSDYFYGGRINLKSKSIVVYTRSNLKYEIIQLYNFDFQNFQSKLRKFNIICFGHEAYITKTHKFIFMKRVYKYDELFN